MGKIVEPVEIDLDRKRLLRLDMFALMAAEREINKTRCPPPPTGEGPSMTPRRLSIFNVIHDEITSGDLHAKQENWSNISIELVLILFWAALLADDSKLTLEQAGHLTSDLKLVIQKTVEAVGRAFAGGEVEEPEEEEKKTIPLNGSISGPSPGSNSD